MKILDPLTGNQCDENGNTVVSYETFKQRLLNKAVNFPKPVPVLDKEWDEDAGRDVPTIHIDRDPGDER